MNKLTYTYTNVPKQLLFYICAFYLVLRSIMDIQIVLYQVEGYADQINLPLELTVNALFFIPFFRDGKINVLEHKRFYDLLKEREAAIGDAERFVVYRSYKEVPGYSRKWKYVSFAYACLDVLLGLNCFTPIAVILGLLETFR